MTDKQTQADFVAEAKRFDPKQYLFKQGVFTLMELGGKNERTVRAFLGKCLKATKDNPYPVMEALEKAQDKADPFSFMSAALKGREDVEIDDPFLLRLEQDCKMKRPEIADWFCGAKITEGVDQVMIEVKGAWKATQIKQRYADYLKIAARGKPVIVRAA